MRSLFGSPEDHQALRDLTDTNKRRLRAEFSDELNGGFWQMVPVVVALAETLAEIMSTEVSPDTAIALFQHMIDDVRQDVAKGRTT